MNSLNSRRFMAAIMLFALSFAAFGVAQGEEKQKVTLGYIPVAIYAPLYIGIDRGYFADEGIDLELVPVPAGGGDSIVQLAAGNFDAAATGAGASLWNAAHQGLEFRIVAPLHTERPPLSTPLIIAADRTEEIKSVADLKGKKIGINAPGSAIEYWVYSALTKAGLTMEDVEIVPMPFPQMPDALAARAIDAAVMTDPLTTLAKAEGKVAVLADDYINGITVTYIFFGIKLINDRPDVAEGFMRAYLRALRDLQGDGWITDETAQTIEKFTKVPAAVVQKMNRPYFALNGQISLADLEEVQRYFLSRGVLEYKEPLDVATFVDTTFMEKALEALGALPEPTMEATPAQ
jgi:NitT/TauT family transport system substrate-binding protein